MPEVNEVNLDYGALTIDTCIFDQLGLNLERGLFKQLVQFADGPIRLVFVDIIRNELKKHLLEKIEEARSKVEQAIRAAKVQFLSNDDQIESARILLLGDDDSLQIAENRLAAFFNNINAEIIETNRYADISKLLQIYFDTLPPFENTNEKKHEFPDAFTLLSLEKWAEEKNIKVLAVSRDRGWRNYASNTDRIDVIEDLGDAINLFQSYKVAWNVIDELRKVIMHGERSFILDAISESLEDNINSSNNILVFAESSYFYDEEEVFANYVSHDFCEDLTDGIKINLIRIDTDIVVLQLFVNVAYEVKCTFSFSIRDSIDKDYVSIGNNSITSEENCEKEVLVSLGGNLELGLSGLKIEEVEILDDMLNANFGNVDPDWGYKE